ncbi:MAG: PhzF family phenazine biosynthesis protein [Streptosporangiaceae bacterium]
MAGIDSVQRTGWWGRVFGDGPSGGNHTVVVLSGAPNSGLQDIARWLAVPDTGFVTARDDQSVSLRTFSPVEEVSQCIQVSLAALTALGAPDKSSWSVRHEHGEKLLVTRDDPVTWAEFAAGADLAVEPAAWPSFVQACPDPGFGQVIVRQSRSRIYLPCRNLAELEALELDPRDVVEFCASSDCFGVVAFTQTGRQTWRARVFTTSLAGKEDSATGGAVLGVGGLLARRGVTGTLRVTQGPGDPDRQGTLLLRIFSQGHFQLGGEVVTLQRGQICV